MGTRKRKIEAIKRGDFAQYDYLQMLSGLRWLRRVKRLGYTHALQSARNNVAIDKKFNPAIYRKAVKTLRDRDVS